MKAKSAGPIDSNSLDSVGYSYGTYLIESALRDIQQLRKLFAGDIVDDNYELEKIEQLLQEALDAA